MIDIDRQSEDHFVTCRFRGRLSARDVEDVVAALALCRAGRRHDRILFDWTGIESWVSETSGAKLWRNWRDESGAIKRAAIVHEHRWNRQAALLGATLRMSRTQIRSWRPRDLPLALAWLNETARPAGPGQIEMQLI